MPRKKTQEEVIQEFREVHGDRYDYSLVEYINDSTSIDIICPIHGVFHQVPNSHKHGHGCPYCAGNIKNTKEDFIFKAKAVHGDKYDYSKVNYINNSKKVCIICHEKDDKGIEHGEFWIEPGSHKRGRGCPICAGNKKLTKEEFIRKAILKHGDTYDYSLVDNIENNKTIVKIKCNKCGHVFEQIANNHLNGHGCQYCKLSHLEEQTMLFLEKYSIKYNYQQTFNWLKSSKKWPMFLDFYLPKYRVAIECQGEQHYMSEGNGYFTTEGIKYGKQRDVLKYNLCQEHGIQIFYIKYDENVEERLNKILIEINNSI